MRSPNSRCAYRDDGVVGFDIAGAEAGFPPSRHLDAFEYLRRENYHFTIHAGEAFGLPSIWEAIQWCGTDRLGHGVRIVDDIQAGFRLGGLAKYVRDKRIPLEMCPSSNVQTGAAESIATHPIGLLRRLQFRVTVNTDNRLMSGTSMSREMALLAEAFDYTWADLRWFTINAMKSAFIGFDERLNIINSIDQARLCSADGLSGQLRADRGPAWPAEPAAPLRRRGLLNAGSDFARASSASVIAPASDATTVSTMSPPAAMKRTARWPGEYCATCAAAPTSSLITTPRKPSSPRSMPVTMVRENAAGFAGSILRVDRGRHHHERHVVAHRGAERREVRVVAGGDGVGHPGRRVGVAGDPAEAREVFDGDVDPGGRHAVGDRQAVRRDRLGVWPYSRSRSPIGGLPVEPGGTVSSTGARLRFTPTRAAGCPRYCACVCNSAGASWPCTTALGMRGEARPLQPLHRPALLVGRDEQAGVARREAAQLRGDTGDRAAPACWCRRGSPRRHGCR